MSADRERAVAAAARLLDTKPAALLRQLARNGRHFQDGRVALDGVSTKWQGCQLRIQFDQRWTDGGGVLVEWLSVEQTALALGVSRSMLGKRLEPGRVGAKKKSLELVVSGRQVQARRFGRLWKLRIIGSAFAARDGEAA